ncbi:hypothetical protein SNE40_010089 [Patella caerulea]|uniref:G-protein coupled receptors family 1 profile domain-containing protein n=1 Tax=Patella caerulea TaxID=87958 RepID=A0AAN8Q451_PATCE
MAEISIFDLTNNASVYHSKDEELYWEYYGGNGTESYSPSSCGDLSDRHRDYTQIPAVSMAIAVLYSLVIFLAVTGNSLVIWTVWRNTHMHTVTNYYIVNLAISDLLVSAIVMPLKLLEYTAPCEWHVFGSDALCSVLNYLLPIFVFASVLTLVAISLER